MEPFPLPWPRSPRGHLRRGSWSSIRSSVDSAPRHPSHLGKLEPHCQAKGCSSQRRRGHHAETCGRGNRRTLRYLHLGYTRQDWSHRNAGHHGPPGHRSDGIRALRGVADQPKRRLPGRGSAKSFHAVSRSSMGRLVLRPWCRSAVAILVCPARRSRLIVVLRRVAMTCGPLPVRSWCDLRRR